MSVVADFYFKESKITGVNYGSFEWQDLFENKLKLNREKTTINFFARVIVPVLVLCGASITTTIVGKTNAFKVYVQGESEFRSNIANMLLYLEEKEVEKNV